MAARKNRGVGNLPDEWKDKIKASLLVNRLMGCAMGEIELSQQQIKAAEILLKKVIPDINKMDMNVNETLTLRSESVQVLDGWLAELGRGKQDSEVTNTLPN